MFPVRSNFHRFHGAVRDIHPSFHNCVIDPAESRQSIFSRRKLCLRVSSTSDSKKENKSEV